jgi:hypothetical protein
MANKTISQLDDLPEVTSDDLAVVVDLSTLSTRKASMGNLRTFFVNDVEQRVEALEETPRRASETFTISNIHMLMKRVTLTNTPLPGYDIIIFPRGGCAQFLGDDFSVDGTSVSWESLGLDGLLEVGDIIHVDYYY